MERNLSENFKRLCNSRLEWEENYQKILKDYVIHGWNGKKIIRKFLCG
jgi:hypothetical protein